MKPGARPPDPRHQRPEGVTDTTVEALGALSKALETAERARGALYDFHQLTGSADLALDDAVRLLRAAGHGDRADQVEREIIGRNVIPGHWTFQIVEEYNATYYDVFRTIERQIRLELAEGRDHLYEAEMKADRRTEGHPDHTADLRARSGRLSRRPVRRRPSRTPPPSSSRNVTARDAVLTDSGDAGAPVAHTTPVADGGPTTEDTP